MEIITTPIKDLLIVKPKIFTDDRGFFFETYNENRYKELGISQNFVQDNQSKSSYGVIRGLHFQHNPYCQSKLVSVTIGKVWDVAVDLRVNSTTYGQWYGVELTEDNHLQFLIPRGFAHGFYVLSDEAVFIYKVDNRYAPQSEHTLAYNDPALNIQWPISPENPPLLSDKDINAAIALDEVIAF